MWCHIDEKKNSAGPGLSFKMSCQVVPNGWQTPYLLVSPSQPIRKPNNSDWFWKFAFVSQNVYPNRQMPVFLINQVRNEKINLSIAS